MNESVRSYADSLSDSSKIYQDSKPMFDLPKLFLFDKDEYQILLNQYMRQRNDQKDGKAIYYSQLNINLSYNDMDVLHNDNTMTPSMMIFMLNYLYNEEGLRGELRPKVFFQPVRIHHAKKQLFDLYEEWSQYLKCKEYNKKNFKYLCEIMHINGRWVLLIMHVRSQSAVIVDFKYNDQFPLIDILSIFNTITQKTYDINLSTYAVEGVLFTAPESTDCGYYIISYLSKFIQGAPFDKIKFSSKEKSLLKLNNLWLILKLKQTKPSTMTNLDNDRFDGLSRNSKVFSQHSIKHSPSKGNLSMTYMKIIQDEIKRTNVASQTPEFMMQYVGSLKKAIPKVETFLDWQIDPINRPIIDEFGHKIADVIGLLDNKMKLALLQQNSNEYKFLMGRLIEKIDEVEKKKNVLNARKQGNYKRNYAKDTSSLDFHQQSILNGTNEQETKIEDSKVDESNATIKGLEQIIKESIEEVRQGVSLSQSKFQDSIISQNNQNKTQITQNNTFNQPIEEQQQEYQEPSLQQLQQQEEQNNEDQDKQGTEKKLRQNSQSEENVIHSLSHIGDTDKEDNSQLESSKVLDELKNNQNDGNRPMKEIFEDVRDSHLVGSDFIEQTDKTIQIEQRLAGSRFNAFLNSYDNSKNYLEQYNLYYDPKKYFELQKQMDNFKLSMEKNNNQYNHLLQQATSNYPKDESVVVGNSVNNRYANMSMNTMNYINQESQPSFSSLHYNQTQNQTNVSYNSPNKSKSIFVNNSASILSNKPYQHNVSSSMYNNSYNPTDQQMYKQLLNKKPSNFQMQNSMHTQQISFQDKLQAVRSKTNPLQDIGRQSLQMRKQGADAQYQITLEEIIKIKQRYYQEQLKKNSSYSFDDEENKGKTLENPFKIPMDYKKLIHMISTDFVYEEAVNFCMGYFQKKNEIGQLDQTRILYYKRLLILPTDFYYILTFDVENRRDNMNHNQINQRLENLNFDLIRPFYEIHGNIFENYDKILIPICFKIVNEHYNQITLEYQLVVADINEKLLYLYVLNRENLISQDLQHSAVLTNVIRWLEYEYQWVFMKNFDSKNWKVIKGLVSKTADSNLTGYYLVYLVSQILLGFNKCESITNSQIKNVKQNISETLVKVSNDYSIDKLPITDFLKYPL